MGESVPDLMHQPLLRLQYHLDIWWLGIGTYDKRDYGNTPQAVTITLIGKQQQKNVVAELPEHRQSVSSTQPESMLQIFGNRASSLTPSETNGQVG